MDTVGHIISPFKSLSRIAKTFKQLFRHALDISVPNKDITADNASSDAFMEILSVDIISEIFLLVLNNPQWRVRRMQQLTTLRLVSKGWNHFLETFPTVWTDIDLADSLVNTRSRLLYSSNCPLFVTAPAYPDDRMWKAWKRSHKKLTRLLLPHSARIRILRIRQLALSHPSIKALLQQSLPGLEDFQYSTSPHIDSSAIPGFLTNHIRQLLALSVYFTNDSTIIWDIPSDISQLPLQHLEISGSWSATLPLLAKSPSLTSLTIMSAWPPPARPPDHSSNIISLQNLRVLRFHAGLTDPSLLFSRLRIAQLEELRVTLDNTVQSTSLLHLLRHTVIGESTASHISLTFHVHQRGVKIRKGRLLLILEAPYSTRETWEHLDHAAEKAFSGRPITMQLEGHSCRAVSNKFMRLSACVTELILDKAVGWDASCRGLMMKEKYATPDGTRRVRWIFPNLQGITLPRAFGGDVRHIVNVLRARSTSAARALQLGDPAPRISIRFVASNYDELTPQLMQALRDVASDVITG